MAKAQAKIIDDIWNRRAPNLPIKSPGELVTLASMVEKETGKADERARVAGVFVNRSKHMKLQSDPTIVYGLVFGKGTLGHPISKADLDTATPYNTYNIDGLPPGPICNPGKAALEAAANPSPTKELYFVADGTGGHAFAETLDQHLKNVANWRKIEQDAKDRLAPDAATPGAPAPAPTSTHGEAAPIDPKVFGALAPASDPTAKPESVKTLAASWRKSPTRGASRRPRSAASRRSTRLGAVVTGVNDAPEDSFRSAAMLSAASASEPKSVDPGVRPQSRQSRQGVRRFRGHAARPAAQQDLRSELGERYSRPQQITGAESLAWVSASAIAAALETLRLLIAPGSSSLAIASQRSRVSRRNPLSSAPSTSASGLASRTSPSETGASASSPTSEVAEIAELFERTREVGHDAERHMLEPARRRLGERAGEFRRMPFGDDEAVDREGRGGAQDRPDVVRIGDLVEDENEPVGRQLGNVDRLQRTRFEQHALVHGVARQSPAISSASAIFISTPLSAMS